MSKHIARAVLAACVIFLVSMFAGRALVHDDPFLRQVIFKIILAVLSIIAGIWIFRLPLSAFRLSVRPGKGAARYIWLGLLMGAIASALILVLGLPPIPLLKQLSFGRYIIAIWFVSSICEEIFARGLIQGIVHKHEPATGNTTIPLSIWTGAACFSLMHISIYITGGNLFTCLIIMVFALLLGLAAGIAKTKESLMSAIYVHIAFNIGGLIGGIVTNIIAKITTGHFLVQ